MAATWNTNRPIDGGPPPGCGCSQAGGHTAGECPDDCWCEACACTCGLLCTLAGALTTRHGGCGCGCLVHAGG